MTDVGRVSAEFVGLIRRKIARGEYAPGRFLPSLRELSDANKIARKTVHNALKKLEIDGFVSSEPRKGYRVLARASDPDLSCPLAYIADLRSSPEQWKPLHQELLSALQGAAAQRNWTLMGVGSQGRNAHAVLQHLTNARVGGLFVDSVDRETMDAIRQTGMPAVAVDAWNEEAPIDVVVQDSHQGGMLAAEYLQKRGHQRVAWLGPTKWSAHSLARVSGTLAGFLKHGRLLDAEHVVDCARDEAESAARALLSRAQRPTGIVALYREVATVLVKVAREMGLKLGTDLEVVGWCTEQEYERDWLPLFQNEPPQPAVVWKPALMAQLAVDRLEVRRRTPNMVPIRINVPVELRATERRGV